MSRNQSPRGLLAEELSLAEPDMDLARAALLVAQEEYPQLSVELYLARLDQIAEEVKDRLADETASLLVLQEMLDTLYRRRSFGANRKAYYDPRNSFLNDVLDRGVGIPLTLGMVVLEVGWRLGIPLEGVNFPGHFLVRFRGEALDLLVDPFDGGKIRFEDQAQELLDRAYGGVVRLQTSFMREATKRDMLVRMLTNLKGVYMRVADHRRALAAVERILMLTPHGAHREPVPGPPAGAPGTEGGGGDPAREVSEGCTGRRGRGTGGGHAQGPPGGSGSRRRGGAVTRTSSGYEAARAGLALFRRTDRRRLRVHGRAPRQMLNGILTGTLPEPPTVDDDGVASGLATYHAVLTPKGRMITDAWAFLPGDEETDGFLLDLPQAGAQAFAEHLRKVLPPRFARHEDVSEATGMLVVAGPEAASVLSRLAFGLRVDPDTLVGLEEGAWVRLGADGVMAARTREVDAEAYSLIGTADAVGALGRRVLEAGAVEATQGDWETLRVESGRPAFGVDMTDATIPVEAGIHDRAIDYDKGCYTGQEVIVRIRDRGHVNRHLRRLLLGDVPAPEPGTELFAPGGGDKAVGWITSAVVSPREGGVVALAYVRRGTARVTFGSGEVAVE